MYTIAYTAALLVLLCRVSIATECLSSGMLNTAVNSTRIIFNSPGFPADYARPLSCKWLFIAPENEVVIYRLLTFDVYPSIFCLKDVLDIYDGSLKYSPVMQSWCGTRPSGQTIRMTTRYSMVTFQAVTKGDNRQGFEFEVWSEVKYVPAIGEAHLGPAHITLVAVSVALFLIFAVFLVVVVRKGCAAKRHHEMI